MKKIALSILTITMISTIYAQTPMSLSDAVGIALSENYSVEISNNTTEAAQNLATRGQAGQLPTVSASGLADYGNDNTRLQLTGSPTIMETNGAQSTLLNASVDVAYTVFSGGANVKRYKKLKVNADLSDVQNRIEIESVLMQVISAYYNVLRAQDNLDALEENMALSGDRLEFTRNQHEYSGGSRANMLSAQVDLNKDSVSMVTALQALDEAKISFNQVLNRDLSAEVVLDRNESIGMMEEDYEALKTAMADQNWQMKASRMSVQASMLDYKISKSAYIPQLNLTASYAYSRSDAEGSFLQLNSSNGLCVALSLKIPIYSGGTKRTAVKNAQLDVRNKELQVKQTELALEADLKKAFSDYQRAKSIVEMEEKNLELNLENFEYTKKQYEQGMISQTTFRQAQINLLLTRNNLSNTRYNVHLAELELHRLSGGLVQRF